MVSFAQLNHVQRVRRLYKTILQLHRGLPPELRSLGDEYVKDEFRRHRDAPPEYVGAFMKEWADYALNLSHQIKFIPKDLAQSGRPSIGQDIGTEQYDRFSEEQLAQLLALAESIYKTDDSKRRSS